MLSPSEILQAARKKWPAALRADAAGDIIFPLNIRFGRPQTTEGFDIVSPQIESLAKATHPWRITWEVINTRKWGEQRWPAGVAFDTIEDLARALDAEAELRAFRVALRETRATCPALDPWIRKNAHRVIGHLDTWADLVAVCAFFTNTPRPGCYPRQITSAPDTKFIERNKGILRELLDATLGSRANRDADGFADRFGLLAEPAQVRFRFLDPALQATVGWPVAESTVPVGMLRQLAWSVPHVVIVENRDVFLCLPDLPDTLGIWGSGKAVPLLDQLSWLKEADVVYWGDCDEAGFGILSTLRSFLPNARSVLMDLATWRSWKSLAVQGNRDRNARHEHLTKDERDALDAVIAGPWLLEQERIPPEHATRVLKDAISR